MTERQLSLASLIDEPIGAEPPSPQEQAFDKLSRLKSGALFMEMGTGKTKVALDLAASKAGKVDFVLWICPVSLKNEIEAERQKWHPELNLEVVGVESIGSSNRIFLEVFEKVQKFKVFAIVDESLKIKNIKAKRTQRILDIGKFAKYRLILNGTPISKNVLDLWPQMEFLSPKILDMSYNRFMDTYCEYYIRGKLKGKVKNQCNVEHLMSKINPYVFDCNLEIPVEKHFYDFTYSMDDEFGYAMKKEELLANYDEESFVDTMRLFTELQVFYTADKAHYRMINRLVEQIGSQVIVFVKFKKTIPENADYLTGELSQEERKQVVENFKNGKIQVLYITYGVGAYGLNLQCCNHMIFADHSFDYAQRIQAEARVYRRGQTQDVHYYNLWCNCGMENLIKRCLSKKIRLSDEVKNNLNKGKGGSEWVRSM